MSVRARERKVLFVLRASRMSHLHNWFLFRPADSARASYSIQRREFTGDFIASKMNVNEILWFVGQPSRREIFFFGPIYGAEGMFNDGYAHFASRESAQNDGFDTDKKNSFFLGSSTRHLIM
jgi:hypothetical protein